MVEYIYIYQIIKITQFIIRKFKIMMMGKISMMRSG